MTKALSNKNSIQCIIRQQLLNKISYEKLSDLKSVMETKKAMYDNRGNEK